MKRYGIGEWYGEHFPTMAPDRRRTLASFALGKDEPPPSCPFKRSSSPCSKKGGVCTLQEYEISDDRIGNAVGLPVTVCPSRFDEHDLIPRWLAEIAGFEDVYVAREVPFMRAPTTGREAGRIDIVLANSSTASDWYGLEIQAVYFSGDNMTIDFKELLVHGDTAPPKPGKRRPDWRSSSAKRLMPQLEVKAPTLRRWGKKLAVSVDLPFFMAIGGPSEQPSHDINEGDILWLVPQVDPKRGLIRHHWEVLSLEASSHKLLSAKPVKREEFETDLRSKLARLDKEP